MKEIIIGNFEKIMKKLRGNYDEIIKNYRYTELLKKFKRNYKEIMKKFNG